MSSAAGALGYLPGGETPVLEVLKRGRHPLYATLGSARMLAAATAAMSGVLNAQISLMTCAVAQFRHAPAFNAVLHQVPTEAEIQELYTALELDAPDEPLHVTDADSSVADSSTSDTGRSVFNLTVSFACKQGFFSTVMRHCNAPQGISGPEQ